MDIFSHWVIHYGYAGIFALLVLGIVGLPVPDEGVLMFAGYLCWKGTLQLFPCIVWAFLGSVCGITLSYVLGRTLGFYFAEKYGRFLGVTPQRLELVHGWFKRIGKWTLVIGYFVPGVRHLTAFVAGSSKLEFGIFSSFAYAGGFLWSVSFLLLGYFFGKRFSHVFAGIHHGFVSAMGLAALLGLAYFSIACFAKRR